MKSLITPTLQPLLPTTSPSSPLPPTTTKSKSGGTILSIALGFVFFSAIGATLWYFLIYKKNKLSCKTKPCENVEDICIDNKCVKATTQDCSTTNKVGKCPAGQICDSNGLGCISIGKFGCTIDANCLAGQKCEHNICVTTTPEIVGCITDNDCLTTADQKCENKVCVPRPKNDRCGPGENQTGWLNWDGVEISGGDIIKQVPIVDKAARMQTCANECDQTPGCTFAIYDNSNNNDTQPEKDAFCWLKKGGQGSAATSGANRSSVFKLNPASCTSNSKIGTFVYRPGTTVEGTQIGTSITLDEGMSGGLNLRERCEQKCTETENCQASVISTTGNGQCNLYSNVRGFKGVTNQTVSFHL